VLFDSPVPASQLKSDPAGVANAKAQVAAARDAIVSWHFGSATSPTQGQGFDRGLSRFQITPGFAVNVSPSELQALASDPRVTRINYDRVLRANLIESVPLIGMTAAYSMNATGAGQAVAVLDTGIKFDHEFLVANLVAEACFSNASPAANRVSLCPNGGQSQFGVGAARSDATACMNGSSPINLCEHGSHVAGIAAGLNTNQQAGEPPNGVAKNAKIFAIQVFTRFNDAGECSPDPAPCVGTWISDHIHALDHVFANINLGGGTVVASVNMSFGGGLFSGTCDSAPQKPAIDNLRAAGVLAAIASGNDDSTTQISSPACTRQRSRSGPRSRMTTSPLSPTCRLPSTCWHRARTSCPRFRAAPPPMPTSTVPRWQRRTWRARLRPSARLVRAPPPTPSKMRSRAPVRRSSTNGKAARRPGRASASISPCRACVRAQRRPSRRTHRT
jgi:subtilisin family serine protease